MRRSSFAFGWVVTLTLVLALEITHAGWSWNGAQQRIAASADLVRRAGLTDLALFTEARYSRHPAMADLHSAFQDNPLSFEHFPSGVFAPRPAAGWGRAGLGFDQTLGAR